MKIRVNHIHLRIEDIGASMLNKTFSFGLSCDLIEYSYVTKHQNKDEAKVVPKLVLNNLAVYWTTMDNYIIRPLNIKWLDTSVTISPLIVTIDINILNHFRCLTNLMSYHKENIDKKLVYVNRPKYLETAVESPRKYWKFAITNVINILRRKKVNTVKIKKQYEMKKLVEMLILQSIYGMNMMMVKQYFNEKGLEPRLSIFQDTFYEREFEDLEQLKSEIREVNLSYF